MTKIRNLFSVGYTYVFSPLILILRSNVATFSSGKLGVKDSTIPEKAHEFEEP